MQNKNIAVCIILTLVTCGIYGIYWLYTVALAFEQETEQNRLGVSAGVFILLDIITCGIYGIYAFYKWGKGTQEIYQRRGMQGEDRSTLYLILALFSFQIVALALIQNDFNQLVPTDGPPPPSYGNSTNDGYPQAPPPPTPPQPPVDQSQQEPPQAPPYYRQ